jgi:hypothetical protein
LRILVDLALAMVIAIAVGLGSAFLVLDRSVAVGSTVIGAWNVQPASGVLQSNPYVAAATATAIDLPLGTAEGLTFVAFGDDAGEPLAGQCDYVLTGQTLLTRLWTLVLYDGDGRLIANPSGRTSVHSREILRSGNGGFTVAVSTAPQSGNWLPAPPAGAFRLVLRLYETPLTTTILPADLPLPRIVRGDCR